ncbi:MAG: Zn-ribbon containing protein [Candidatus Woesearchaeota archaeon]
MPHQCVRCNTFYEDGADEILKGCPCGGKLFFYIKKEKLDRIRDMTIALSDKEKEQIESDVKEIIGEQPEDEQPVVLDMEAIRILKPGKYELDLVHLFKKDPLIYKVGEGKYLIDLIRTFASMKK